MNIVRDGKTITIDDEMLKALATAINTPAPSSTSYPSTLREVEKTYLKEFGGEIVDDPTAIRGYRIKYNPEKKTIAIPDEIKDIVKIINDEDLTWEDLEDFDEDSESALTEKMVETFVDWIDYTSSEEMYGYENYMSDMSCEPYEEMYALPCSPYIYDELGLLMGYEEFFDADEYKEHFYQWAFAELIYGYVFADKDGLDIHYDLDSKYDETAEVDKLPFSTALTPEQQEYWEDILTHPIFAEMESYIQGEYGHSILELNDKFRLN